MNPKNSQIVVEAYAATLNPGGWFELPFNSGALFHGQRLALKAATPGAKPIKTKDGMALGNVLLGASASEFTVSMDGSGNRLQSIAPARVDRAAISFQDLPEAAIAATILPEKQRVDVEGEQKSYIVIDGVLVFKENFVKSDLASEGGAGMVGVKRPGTWTKKRTSADKVKDTPNFRDWTGLNGSGANDDTVDLKRMIEEVGNSGIFKVDAPEGRFVATAPLPIRKPMRIVGVGNQCPPWSVIPKDPGSGTYFHLAHSGVGFDVSSSDGGVSFESLGTMRTQPQVGTGGFQPHDHDFDFITNNVSDTWFKDVMLLNSSRGILGTNGGAGRLGIWGLRGQPLIEGIRIETMYDVCRIHNVHFWAFWSQSQKVWDWMIYNADAISSFRNDNPFLSDIFTIFYRNGLVIGGNQNGTTSKMKLVNGDFDRGQTAISVLDSASGFTGSFMNVSSQGEGIAGMRNVGIIANAPCEMKFTNLDLRVFGANAVRVGSPGVEISIDNLRVDEWNQTSVGFPAIELVTGSSVHLDGRTNITGGHGASKYGPEGYVNVDEWRPFAPPSIRSSAGMLGSVGPSTALVKYYRDQVDIKAELSVVDAGTGSGALLMGIPPFVPKATMRSVGTGREMVNTGFALQTIIDANGVEAVVYDYKNAFPASSGSKLNINLSYPVVSG